MLLNWPCVSLVLSLLSAFERAGRRGAARLAGGFRVGLRRKFKSPTPLLGAAGFPRADRGVERVFFTVTVLWGGRRFCLPYRAGSPCQTGIVTPVSGTSSANRPSVSAVPGEFAPSGLPLINSPSPRVGAGQPSRGLGRAPRRPFAAPRDTAGSQREPGCVPSAGGRPASPRLPKAHFGFPAPPGLSEAAVAEIQTSRPGSISSPCGTGGLDRGKHRGGRPAPLPRCPGAGHRPACRPGHPPFPEGLPPRSALRGPARPGPPPGVGAAGSGKGSGREGGRESGPRLSRPPPRPGSAEVKPAAAPRPPRPHGPGPRRAPQGAPGGEAVCGGGDCRGDPGRPRC